MTDAPAGGAPSRAAVLLLSSDLPLVNRRAVVGMLASARRLSRRRWWRLQPSGEVGTNTLYLSPPGAIVCTSELGNFPQAFSYVGLIEAALNLEKASAGAR